MSRAASDGNAAISFEANSGGNSAFTSLKFKASVTTDLVVSPVADTSVFSTTPVAEAASTVMPPPSGSAFICTVG